MESWIFRKVSEPPIERETLTRVSHGSEAMGRNSESSAQASPRNPSQGAWLEAYWSAPWICGSLGEFLFVHQCPSDALPKTRSLPEHGPPSSWIVAMACILGLDGGTHCHSDQVTESSHVQKYLNTRSP